VARKKPFDSKYVCLSVNIAETTFHQSLRYCSNSCTSLHFKTLKSHTKTLQNSPLRVSVSFETIFRGSVAVLRYVTELESVDLHLL